MIVSKRGRFNFKAPRPLGKVVAAEGQYYEVTFDVPSPMGKEWGDRAIILLDLINIFYSSFGDEGVSNNDATSAIKQLREAPGFWEDLFPACLGILGTEDEDEGKEYLTKYLTNQEVVNLFVEATAMIVRHSFQGEEVQEALEKLEGGGGQEEGQPAPN